jgi:DNA-binding transcriptional regulator LsrR (DeoR family)
VSDSPTIDAESDDDAASASAVGQRSARFSVDSVYQAARMYYVEEATQVEIASRLGVSRPTVSRLVAEARRLGLVRIEVTDPYHDENIELGAKLKSALGLQDVWLSATTHATTLGDNLSEAVASALANMSLKAGDVLLVSSGRTMHEVAQGPLPPLPGVQLAPTVGGLTEPSPWFQTNEITLRAAERSGGFPSFLFAQALPSVDMRRSLDDDPAFQHVVGLWETARGALLGIGAPTVTRDTISRFIPVAEGSFDDAVGDVCLNFFDAAGDALEFPGSDRVVRTSRAVLQHIPHAVGVAVGPEKVPSILGAVRARLVNELVTDTVTARALLAESTRAS